MLQYLIILLDKTSTSFCHYSPALPVKEGENLIPLKTLQEGIRFGMMENLMIQFVYPDYELPQEYKDVVESIDHSKIKPVAEDADVLVVDEPVSEAVNIPVVWRVSKKQLFQAEDAIVTMLEKTPRLNIVITDVETFTDEDFTQYKSLLEKLAKHVEQFYVDGKTPQLNLLTDRMMLSLMNNCGAGETTITLAPNGKFYVCPAFYYEDETDCIGDLEHRLDIKNKQLYRLDHAPICRHCDAWQCKRCIWLNRKTTQEVNTPSHEQCVVAHLERNASRDLLQNIRKHGTFLPEQEDIKEIDYWDPFDKRDTWQ
ncbi:MAG: CXXX repeat peptide maturase [Bacteroidaceae bacterium]|nr:CXXX repeat peptide maturase [Bacteroidaceae bacterium]